MARLPRMAIGTVQPEADATAIVWALMDCLQRAGLRVQSFLSQAYFSPRDGATAITGLSPRHLDSWLMSDQLCQELFVRGSSGCDLAVVEGSFQHRKRGVDGGDLETLCRWLDLPRLGLLDARLLGECRIPERPRCVDALLLDKVSSLAELYRLQTLFESLWNVPVLGWLGMLPSLRNRIESICPASRPAVELCHALGDQFQCNADLAEIRRLANSREFKGHPLRLPLASTDRPKLRVAVAYDDAFRGYFPDTLDMLELAGATLCDFSPLRDDRLPSETDVVYLGCGHPELFAAELAENDCMMLAIKNHLCSGRRIYAECGGLAYLCQQIETSERQCWPMVGALPATACCHDPPEPPYPAEVTMARDTWLGPKGATCRGYINRRWSIAPGGPLSGCATQPGHELDLVQRHRAIGSRLHLNFAAQPHLLDCFFRPHATHSDTAHARLR